MQTKNIYYKENIYIDYQYQSMTPGFVGSVIDFEEYLSILTHYPYIGEEKLKDGQEVVENVHYRIGYQENVRKRGEHWMHVWKSYYNKISNHNKKRIVAIGIPKAIIEGKEYCDKCDLFTSKTPNGYCKECGNFIGQITPISEKTEEKETQEDMWNEVTASYRKNTFPVAKDINQRKFLITRK